MLLKNKTAIITGCNRGIGRAVLERFACNGANIWACSRIADDAYEKACAKFSQEYGVEIRNLYFDISDEEQIKSAVKTIAASKTAVDVLVNNAGVAHGGMFAMTPSKDIRSTFDVNYFGTVLFSQGIARLMLRKKSGAIINIASAAGIDGRSGNIAYGASKAALILATKTMSGELAAQGIRVNAVAPGIIETDMLHKMDEKAREQMESGNDMGRIGQPEEVADVVLFLASEMSGYVTGQVLRVDGGLR